MSEAAGRPPERSRFPIDLPEVLERVDGTIRIAGHRISLYFILDALFDGVSVERLREMYPTVPPSTLGEVVEFCMRHAEALRWFHSEQRAASDTVVADRARPGPSLEELRRRRATASGQPAGVHDPDLDGPSTLESIPTKPMPRSRTWILAAITSLSLAWAAVVLTNFVRIERRRGRPEPAHEFHAVSPHRPGTNLDRAHFEQIRIGMTLPEVEAILGGPPGQYDGTIGFRYAREPRMLGKGPIGLEWNGAQSNIAVLLDSEGLVRDMEFCPGTGIR